MSGPALPSDPIRLFSDYVKVTGIGRLESEPGDDAALLGKRLGLDATEQYWREG